MPNPTPARPPVAPGVILRREAAERDWTPEDTAEAGLRGRRCERGQVERIALELERLVHDKVPPPLTEELAVIIARAFDTSVSLWRVLELQYRDWEVGEMITREEKCAWIYARWYGADDVWETACDNTHEFFDGTPAENNYLFCPYCGKEIIVEEEK